MKANRLSLPCFAARGLAAALVVPAAFTAPARAGTLASWIVGPDPVTAPFDVGAEIVQVATSDRFVFMLTSAGEVREWVYPFTSVSVPFDARSGVASIAAGDGFVLALKSDGSVVAWGANGWGQTKVPAEALSDVKAVFASDRSSAAVKRDGTMVEWGATPANVGADFPAEARTNVAKVVPGLDVALVVKTDGSLRVAGDRFPVLAAQAQSGVVDAAIMSGSIVLLKANGALLTWPQERWDPAVRRLVPNVPPILTTNRVSGVASILVNEDSGVAVMRDGTVARFFGSNPLPEALSESVVTSVTTYWPQNTVGLPDNVTQRGFAVVDGSGDPGPLRFFREPKGLTVAAFAEFTLTAVASGFPTTTYQWRRNGVDIPLANAFAYHVAEALQGDAGIYTVVARTAPGVERESLGAIVAVQELPGGVAVAWGDMSGTLASVPIGARSGAAMIAASGTHSIVLRRDGVLLEWGQSRFRPATNPRVILPDTYLPVAIAAGTSHSLVRSLDNSAKVIDTDSQAAPEVVAVPAGARAGVAAVSAAGACSAVLRTDRSVVVWGAVGPSILKVPDPVQGHAMSVATGPFHVLAVLDDGSVAAWGNSSSGQTTAPAAASNVVAVAAGKSHSLALRLDGAVVGWGADYAGQATVPPAAWSGVIAIAAGGDHSLALKSDGTVVAWGTNDHGESDVPARYQGRVTSIAAGVFHSVAILGGAPLLVPRVTPTGRLEIAWPSLRAGWSPQYTRSLVTPVTWTDLPTTPVARGLEIVAEVPIDGEARWFRLVP